ncbi:MAG: penicillin-binding transpeptidase domain-containing protein [Chloroflexota bacterium]
MKRNAILLLFVIVGLVACGQSIKIPALSQETAVPPTHKLAPTPNPSPTPLADDAGGVARAFYRAWEGRNYLAMYSQLSPQSQALVDSQSFVARYEDAMETAAVITLHAQPQAIIQEGAEAEFGVRVTWETAVVGSITRDYTVRLVYNQNRWGIVWDEGLILPELVGGNRLHLEYRIPARANIYDIDGLALAYQGTLVSLGVVPGQIEDEEGMLAVLSTMLGKTPEEIKEIYAPAQPDWYWPIGDVTEEVMQANAEALQPFIGKGIAPPTTRLTRLYYEGGVAPHLIGYTGPIPAEELPVYEEAGYRGDEIVGLAGLELWGEEYLNGERGGVLSVVGPNGEYISTIAEVEPRQARSIYTSINRDFQQAVEQALAEAITTYPIGQAGSVIVMDVHTGAIRAMASYPSYHPRIFDSVRTNAAAELGAVLSDPGRPLLNRATQGAYPAGSVFKIVTFSAAMNSGLYTPDTHYNSTGTWARLGENFVKTDWRAGGHGYISLRTAIVVSCNSCFYDVGYTLDGVDRFLLPNTARQFGLGQITNFQLAESSGLIPDPDWKIANIGEGWATGDSVNMAIGQGYVQVTPLQIVDMLAAIANGGTLYQPTIIDRIGAAGGAPDEVWPIYTRGELSVTPEILATIQGALFDVANDVNQGTAAYQFVGLPLDVAGKTGTAEDPPRTTHAWFAGYAPASPYTLSDGTVIDQPEIAIVVMIENAGEGSAVAAPIFRRIIELYYGITPVTPFPW